jgi:hypothetical protein
VYFFEVGVGRGVFVEFVEVLFLCMIGFAGEYFVL